MPNLWRASTEDVHRPLLFIFRKDLSAGEEAGRMPHAFLNEMRNLAGSAGLLQVPGRGN